MRITRHGHISNRVIIAILLVLVQILVIVYFTQRTSKNLNILSLCPLKVSTGYGDQDTELLRLEDLNENVGNVEDNIKKNLYLAGFNITSDRVKRKVTLLIVISSGPGRYDRRNMIRDTWWKQCVPTEEIVPECIFITDEPSPTDRYYKEIQHEVSQYGDLKLQNLNGGVEFGKRFLYHMVYAVKHYQFEYFLRMDDDYFLCLARLLHELPMPMERYFHWGWVHCEPRISRPEESILMLSRDLVEIFLSQDPDEMLCHPFADQMIAAWSNSIDMRKLFRHDNRLHHHPPVRMEPALTSAPDVCERFIGVHGAYPDDMKILWTNRGERNTINGDLISNSRICQINEPFDWRQFDGEHGSIYQYPTRVCSTNPIWDTSKQVIINGSYAGRQHEIKSGKAVSANKLISILRWGKSLFKKVRRLFK